MHLHACFLDRECRRYGGIIWRVYVSFRKGWFELALAPNDKWQKYHRKQRKWDHDKYVWFQWVPNDHA